MHPALRRSDHQPWPLPPGRWTWRQSWYDLLFAHWPVPAADLRRLVPDGLTVQEFDGTSWVGPILRAPLAEGRGPPMKLRPVRLIIIGTAVYVAANPKARARVGELVGQARQKIDEKRGRAGGDGDLGGVAPYVRTPEGDVSSEDRAGTWADDGGVPAGSSADAKPS